ncbi:MULTISPECIES: hypothetical protein [unclassified Microcoleus]|uniref:hypothetical protein n=1 Tax=unclassified Microcoleus TaxID=2642155 RepID=UPI0025F5A5A0|nr:MULTISPECIES: hypothetical protein [unclassified Microcoleus]
MPNRLAGDGGNSQLTSWIVENLEMPSENCFHAILSMVVDPPDCSNRQATVAVKRLPQQDQSSGKEYA